MTPAKEKALELVGKMYAYQWRKDTIEYNNAVNCAIIAVGEVLSSINYPNAEYLFYLQVKTELEKLL